MSGHGFIAREQRQQCDFCGKIAELRPYGPNGETVCFCCGMKDVEAVMRGFERHVVRPAAFRSSQEGDSDA